MKEKKTNKIQLEKPKKRSTSSPSGTCKRKLSPKDLLISHEIWTPKFLLWRKKP